MDDDGDFPGDISDGRQYFPAAPEQDADVLEVLIGKMGKDRDVDAVLRKCAGVFGQAEPCEPIGNLLQKDRHTTEPPRTGAGRTATDRSHWGEPACRRDVLRLVESTGIAVKLDVEEA